MTNNSTDHEHRLIYVNSLHLPSSIYEVLYGNMNHYELT